jgi:hypothetical protein
MALPYDEIDFTSYDQIVVTSYEEEQSCCTCSSGSSIVRAENIPYQNIFVSRHIDLENNRGIVFPENQDLVDYALVKNGNRPTELLITFRSGTGPIVGSRKTGCRHRTGWW